MGGSGRVGGSFWEGWYFRYELFSELKREIFGVRRTDRHYNHSLAYYLGEGPGISKNTTTYNAPMGKQRLPLSREKTVVTHRTVKCLGNIWKCGNFATF